MKTSTYISYVLALSLFSASSMHAQFAVFNPDSFGTFHTVSDATNSAENTGAAVSGEFQWDSTQFFLRVYINNLSANPGGGVLTGFGFTTPALVPGAVDLIHTSSGSFAVEQPYAVSPSQYTMPVGAETTSPNSIANGIQPGASAFFDFDFTGAFVNTVNFSYEGFGFSEDGDGFSTSFRFQSITTSTAGSDKVGGYVTEDFRIPTGTAVPEPSFYGLAGIGGLALLMLTRRMKKGAKA